MDLPMDSVDQDFTDADDVEIPDDVDDVPDWSIYTAGDGPLDDPETNSLGVETAPLADIENALSGVAA